MTETNANDDAARLYETIQRTALLSDAGFTGPDGVLCSWTYKHRPSNSKPTLSTSHRFFQDNEKKIIDNGIAIPAMSTNLSIVCNCTCTQALVRQPSNKGDPLCLEIIRKGLPSLSLSLKKICGDICKVNRSYAAFSPDCKMLAFVADKVPAATSSFYAEKEPISETQGAAGNEFDYRQNWGEGASFTQSIIVLVKISADSMAAEQCSSFSENYCWEQIFWHPDKRECTLLACGTPSTGRRLGVLHYQTRPSTLFGAKLPSPAFSISSSDHNANMCHFSPDGTKLVYFCTDDVVLHGSCSRMKLIRWPCIQKPITVVDVVKEDEGFPGIYIRGSRRIWLTDNVHVVICSQWHCRTVLLLVNTSSKEVNHLALPESHQQASCELLDIQSDNILVRMDDIDKPHIVMVGAVSVDNKSCKWTQICSSPCPPPKLPQYSYKILQTTAPGSRHMIESILILPAVQKEGLPLIVQPHGGPHSAFSTSYSLNLAYITAMGFATLLVNYRGSTGYGQNSLESLPGKCGVQDVEDIIIALDHTIEQYPILSKDNLLLMGGSHGGFLTLWLIALYPKLFRAAVARNPVANVAHMVSTSDIPDWCAVECGIEWDPLTPFTADDYRKMYIASPVSMIGKVQTPLLLMLGEVDKRVPMSQSLDYYHLLHARGVECRCIVYPENAHGLTERVDTEADQWVNIVKWFSNHLICKN